MLCSILLAIQESYDLSNVMLLVSINNEYGSNVYMYMYVASNAYGSVYLREITGQLIQNTMK